MMIGNQVCIDRGSGRFRRPTALFHWLLYYRLLHAARIGVGTNGGEPDGPGGGPRPWDPERCNPQCARDGAAEILGCSVTGTVGAVVFSVLPAAPTVPDYLDWHAEPIALYGPDISLPKADQLYPYKGGPAGLTPCAETFAVDGMYEDADDVRMLRGHTLDDSDLLG
ncbi:hypothetical protein DL769_005557 [Monosporascus sp. CRB-8-3]|nr:hypothetical protein DL769_005557 [Monosporascus sp. CRB-8-3]